MKRHLSTEARERIAVAQRARWAKHKAKKQGENKDEAAPEYAVAFAIGYVFREVETIINDLAASAGAGVSATAVAARVGALLLAKANGVGVGIADHMHALRGPATQGSEAMEPVAVADDPSGYSSPRRTKANRPVKRRGEKHKNLWPIIYDILTIFPGSSTSDILARVNSRPGFVAVTRSAVSSMIWRMRGSLINNNAKYTLRKNAKAPMAVAA